MPSKRGKQGLAVACQASSFGILSILDEKLLVEVLRAAKKAGLLGSLASTSRQLCTLARSGVQCCLRVFYPRHAHWLLLLHARGRPQFTGCTELQFNVGHPTYCLLVAGVLSTVQHWPSLQKLQLTVRLNAAAVGAGQSLDFCGSSLLAALPALKQLRSLELRLPELGPCSAAYIGQLVQLTHLQVGVPQFAAAAAAGAAGSAAAAGSRVDLGSWSGLTNLKQLDVLCFPAVQPAAGAMGPSCLPSSLTYLALDFELEPRPDALACWVTHLPGCPQLEVLQVMYGHQQHAGTHPRALVRMLAQHTPHLRELQCWHEGDEPPVWGAAVEGLPDAADPVDQEWHPGPALAALKGLQELTGEYALSVRKEPHWQHLVQLSALTKLDWAAFHYAPPLQAGATLSVLELEGCYIHLGGRGLGRLLLACPQLHTADVTLATPLATTAKGPCEAQLQPHPTLRTLQLRKCYSWSSATPAAAAPVAAAAAAATMAAATAGSGATGQFGELASVLSKVSRLELYDWPAGSSRSPVLGTLPDLSACTAVTRLVFKCYEGGPDRDPEPAQPEQEQFLSMVSPLVQLQRLVLEGAPRVNARVALVLQSLLPCLQHIKLQGCGELLLEESATWLQQQQALDCVTQLLRPGLEVEVD